MFLSLPSSFLCPKFLFLLKCTYNHTVLKRNTVGIKIFHLRYRTIPSVYSVETDVAVFLVSVEDGDWHSRSDGGADRPRGGWGPEPCLPERREAEALSQAEEVKRCRRGGNRSCWIWEGSFCIFLCKGQTWRVQRRIKCYRESDVELWGGSHWQCICLKERNCTALLYCKLWLLHPLSSCISFMQSLETF